MRGKIRQTAFNFRMKFWMVYYSWLAKIRNFQGRDSVLSGTWNWRFRRTCVHHLTWLEWQQRDLRLLTTATTLHIITSLLTFQTLPATWCTNSLTFNNCTLCPHCVYVFCIYLRTNSDLCHLQHKLIGFYNGDEKCLLHGTNWVFK